MKPQPLLTILLLGVLASSAFSHKHQYGFNLEPFSSGFLSLNNYKVLLDRVNHDAIGATSQDPDPLAAADVGTDNDANADATPAPATPTGDTDALAVIASLFQYYLDDNIFSNILHLSFALVDGDKNGVVTRDEYNRALEAEGIAVEDRDRLWDTVQKQNNDTLEFVEFRDLAEIVFDETLAVLTYTFIKGGPEHAQTDGIELQALKDSMNLIFRKLEGGYPMPRCEDFEYLFKQCDVDEDDKLNVKEFFFVLSIYLRFYKSGIENNHFASLILQDNQFDLLWLKEKLIAEHEAKLRAYRISFYRFFQMAVSEKVLQQVAHTLFTKTDKDNTGSLDFTEFYQALSIFGLSESEATLLYGLADTNSQGGLDFASFVSVLETFVHRAVAKFGFLYIQEIGGVIDLRATYTLFYVVITHVGLQPLSDAAFETLFNTVDVDKSGTIDVDEFAKMSSAIISYLKNGIRDEINKKLEADSGLEANEQTIDQAFQNKSQAATTAEHADIADSIISAADSGALNADEAGVQKAIEAGNVPETTAGEDIPFEAPTEATTEAEAAAEGTTPEEAGAVAEGATPEEAAAAAQAEAVAEGATPEEAAGAAAEAEAVAEGATPEEAAAAATEAAAEASSEPQTATPEEPAAAEAAAEGATPEEAAATEAPTEAAAAETPATEAAPAEAAAAEAAATEAPTEAAAAETPALEAAATETPIEVPAAEAAATETPATEAAPAEAAAAEAAEAAATEAPIEAAAAEAAATEAPTEAAVAETPATEAAATEAAAAEAATETPAEAPAAEAAATETPATEAAPAEAAAAEAAATEAPIEAAATEAAPAEALAAEAAATETPATEAAAAEAAATEAPTEAEIAAAEAAATGTTVEGATETPTGPEAEAPEAGTSPEAAAAAFAQIASSAVIQDEVRDFVEN